ncbi:hypothetical protein GJ629_00940 [Halapricum sp. CBA1109]|uniref:DUF2391 family protein n=1 Tax=Halapricum sp. CBA1109 TaxID=2668068 RepID=UPI0012F89A11|nr:hypothetical protein [Halapricum sp. CBA1109]MUV88630.1 hypothetical protein [Halapricum sp. CBA1109]
MNDEPRTPPEDDPATVEELFADLVEVTGDDETARREARDVKHLLVEAADRGLIDSGVRRLDVRDVAEAFVGSVIFASPLLVEDGIFDIGQYLLEFTPAGVPVFLLANTCFVFLMTYALVEWTGRDRDELTNLLGVVPARVMMTLVVSFVVAAVLMTVWGRVDGWTSPVEALARINVIWTVGSLGAALGDILSENNPPPTLLVPEQLSGTDLSESDAPTSDARPDAVRELTDAELLDALHREFDDLESAVSGSADRREVDRIRTEATAAPFDDLLGGRIQKYTTRDVAESFVGSIFFAIPFLVEDGVFEIATFFLSFRLGVFPVYFIVNAAFVLLMILALVYWAGPQEVQVYRPILGIVPRRMVGIALVSFLTAAALMTMWGRVDGWQDPVVALARISVVWTVASFGAALGDILPGESSGADLSEDLRTLGDSPRRDDDSD